MSAPAKQVAASQPAAVHRESLMLRFARAQTVELQGPGPFETPAVQAVLGVTSAMGETPLRLRLLLQDGRTLLIPIDTPAARELLEILERTVPEEDGY